MKLHCTKHHHLLPEERLEILKAADQERKWYSLDDRRVCAICDRVFTGRQVEIDCDQRDHYLLRCPTPGCPSTIDHWFRCEISPARYETFSGGRQTEFSFL